MRKLLASLLILLAFVAPALAQSNYQKAIEDAHDNSENSLRVGKVSPFGEQGVYDLDSIFAIQSVFGTSILRDVETTDGTATISLDEGYIELSTGATASSTATLETAVRGQYQPGTAAEAGLGFFMETPPSGTGFAEWGLGDGDNGAFFRYIDNDSDGDLELCVVYESNTSETVTCNADLNWEGLGDFDVTTEGAVYVIRFTWYGVGGAEYFVYEPDETAPGGLRRHLIHRENPALGQAFEDPNLPIFVTVDNGDQASDAVVDVGGRRYDILGNRSNSFRGTGDFRFTQTITASGSPLVPTVCVRKEEPFPESGRENAVDSFVNGATIISDEDLVAYFSVGGTLTGASWADPVGYTDSETSIETDKSATAISGQTLASSPYAVDGGAQGQNINFDRLSGLRIPIIVGEETCLLLTVPGATDATVSVVVQVVEEW